MKKFSLSVLILSLVVMIAACGAAETPALEPVEAPAPTATEAPEPTTAPEPEATEAPAAEAEAPKGAWVY